MMPQATSRPSRIMKCHSTLMACCGLSNIGSGFMSGGMRKAGADRTAIRAGVFGSLSAQAASRPGAA